MSGRWAVADQASVSITFPYLLAFLSRKHAFLLTFHYFFFFLLGLVEFLAVAVTLFLKIFLSS